MSESDDKSEPEEIQVPPKDLTELDRVNFVVNAIENDCQISPVGAFKMTSAHQVRRNEAFKGLSCEASVCLSSYCHFRNVQCEERQTRPLVSPLEMHPEAAPANASDPPIDTCCRRS